jgi:hypothetical protein
MFEFLVWAVAIVIAFAAGWKLGPYVGTKLSEWWAKIRAGEKIGTPEDKS